MKQQKSIDQWSQHESRYSSTFSFVLCMCPICERQWKRKYVVQQAVSQYWQIATSYVLSIKSMSLSRGSTCTIKLFQSCNIQHGHLCHQANVQFAKSLKGEECNFGEIQFHDKYHDIKRTTTQQVMYVTLARLWVSKQSLQLLVRC